MNRRHFLALMAAVGSAPLLSQCRGRQTDQGSAARPLPQIVAQNGLLELDLTAQFQSQMLAGESTQLLTYNGHSPGPLLELRAGDRVRLMLHNRLNGPTNLHFHGLHISPEVDDVFKQILPGDRTLYEFTLPQNHPALTGWYHPHYHGEVAPQVFGGLAGPVIVRGALDELPELQPAQEAVLVLQDFEPRLLGTAQTLPPIARKWGREGRLLLVNGQQNPVFGLPQNGLLRLRLVNASASRIYQLQLQAHPWFLIATDRGAIAAPVELDTLLLAPGERAEMLISGQRPPGDYALLSLPYDRGIAEMAQTYGDQLLGVASPQQTTLATLRYQPGDRSEPLPLPAQLIPVEPLPKPARRREFVLNHGNDPSDRTASGFVINGKAFDMNRVDTRVKLGTVEEWTLINKASMDHPFHLHTNRFQVVERDGQPVPWLGWKDTVNVPGYGQVTLRVKFEDFTGRTVYHCHILDHEDQGMMGVIEMV